MLFSLVSYPALLDSGDPQFLRPHPKVDEKAILQTRLSNYESLQEPKHYLFLVGPEGAANHQLEWVLATVNVRASILRLSGLPRGAACACLLAMDMMDPNCELLIFSNHQYSVFDLPMALSTFRSSSADAGTITHATIDTSGACVCSNSDAPVCLTSGGQGGSKGAVVGVYYFKRAHYFTDVTMDLIRKERKENTTFSLMGVLKEMSTQDRRIVTLGVGDDRAGQPVVFSTNTTELERCMGL